MNGNLRVKDRITYEQGKLFQWLNNGWVKVLMDTGEVREYQSKDLIGIIGGGRPGGYSANSKHDHRKIVYA